MVLMTTTLQSLDDIEQLGLLFLRSIIVFNITLLPNTQLNLNFTIPSVCLLVYG